MEISIYFVGRDSQEALDGLPFDSFESAHDYVLDDNQDCNIYVAHVEVDIFDLALVKASYAVKF